MRTVSPPSSSRDHGKMPAPSLRVTESKTSLPSPTTAPTTTIPLNRSSGGALPAAVRPSERRNSLAINAAVSAALALHSPIHSPTHSPKGSTTRSPMGSPKGRPARSWNASDVGAWLQTLGLGAYAEAFEVCVGLSEFLLKCVLYC